MVSKLGEENFPGLITELVETLKSDTDGVDRAGAAQGFSEVLAGLGVDRLEGVLTEIVANTSSSKPFVREGFVTLLVFLPETFGEDFQPFLGTVIPCILQGLADESEGVRDASLRAGQMIVKNYATRSVDLLLPELEKGLFDENWRIRQSSVQLMGDLLFRITGISGKSVLEEEEEDGVGTETGRRILIDTLGLTRFHKLLARLYIVRSDGNAIVRQASMHVWKCIISNTPRTLREILPVIMDLIIDSVTSDNYEKQQSAARTLGDLVRKLGESLLDEIVPIFERGLDSDDAYTRQGVCIGMSEVMASGGKNLVEDFVDVVIPSIKKALVDAEPDVREAAAHAFANLQKHAGTKAIDAILPALLSELQTESTGTFALEALKEIMAVQSLIVFPVMIPTLLTKPITSFNASALASLMPVAGSALNKRLSSLLPALLEGLEQEDNAQDAIKEAIIALVVIVDADEGLRTLMDCLTERVKSNESKSDIVKMKATLFTLRKFVEMSKSDFSMYVVDWFGHLLQLMNHADLCIVEAAWSALDKLTKSIPKDDLETYVRPLRRLMRWSMGDFAPGATVPGFCLPKGISPLLPVYLQGLMYGGADVREESALGIGDLVHLTTADALKSFTTQITGPLIRVIGDKFPPSVKAAILHTLSLLLEKVPAMLKPFLPQLQRTFIKSLAETTQTVRVKASRCLSILVTLQPRLEPLVSELVGGIKGADDIGVRESMLETLSIVLKMNPSLSMSIRKSTKDTIIDALFAEKENDGAF